MQLKSIVLSKNCFVTEYGGNEWNDMKLARDNNENRMTNMRVYCSYTFMRMEKSHEIVSQKCGIFWFKAKFVYCLF